VHSGCVSVHRFHSLRLWDPYSWMMVGRNGGRLEKATLQLKNINYSLRSTLHRITLSNGPPYRSYVAFRVCQRLTYLVPVELVLPCDRYFLCIFLSSKSQSCNPFFSSRKKSGCVRAVRYLIPSDHCNNETGEALHQEQQPPRCDGDPLSGFHNQPSKTTCKGRRKRGSRD